MDGEGDFREVAPTPGSRLEQLLALYDVIKAEEATINQRAKAITDGIKAEILSTYVDDLGEPHPRYKIAHTTPLVLVNVHQRRLQTGMVRARYPEIYSECSTQSSVWTLKKG